MSRAPPPKDDEKGGKAMADAADMSILDVDLTPSGHEDGDDGTEDHTLLRLSSSSLAGDDGSFDTSTPPPNERSIRRRRRKIGKGIQLILLRKYVHYAKEFNRLPDRLTTEQLLEQGYDEFYYQGGNLNEPRLSYAAFLKLVRNRRSEVARQTRDPHAMRSRGHRRNHKETLEIRALIDELERVRQGQTPSQTPSQPRSALEYDPLASSQEHMHAVAAEASVPVLSDSSSLMGDGSVTAGELSSADSYSAVMAGATASASEDVVLPRAKLDMMLRVAQETLHAQKKILEEVRALEQRVAGIH